MKFIEIKEEEFGNDSPLGWVTDSFIFLLASMCVSGVCGEVTWHCGNN